MRFRGQDLARLRALEHELGLLSLERPQALSYLLPAVVELLGADRGVAYALEVDEVPRLGFVAGAVDQPAARRDWELLLAERPVGWTGYNALRPEPEQRNRAIDSARMLGWDGLRALPVYQRVMAPHGLAEHDHLRVLVCEGESMLAFVGGLRHGAAFTAYEQALLQALVPALHRRLLVERQLADAASGTRAVEAAMEAVPGEAYLVDRRGRLRQANQAGRLRLERDPRETAERLAAATRGVPTSLRVQLLQGGGALLIQSEPEHRARRVEQAARRYGLTARQTQVLGELARGKSNAEIACALGCSPPTVEVHLRAISDKLDVESRAGILARLLELA